MAELIILDCDGTLVDSEPLVNRIFVDYSREFGFSKTYEVIHTQLVGCSLRQCMDIVETDIGDTLPEDFIDTFRERIYVGLAAECQEVPGATALMESLSIRSCVASNGPRKKMEITLAATNLARFFDDRVYSAYDINVFKPEPDLFFHVAEAENVHPSACLVVEDSMPGILGGLAAGMTTVAFDPGEVLSLPEGVRRVRELSEILSLVSGL
jgi:HAD superfamily hydrolase (TIGR01509 family)